jgi:5-methyltetrahydrofolate--homocysteine methyltransferase
MRSDVFYCRTAMDGVNVMNALMASPRAQRAELLATNRTKLIHRYQHAVQRAAREEELFATLPRRAVSHEGLVFPAEPRFRSHRIEYDLRNFAPHIDRRNLYSLNWKFGGTPSRERTHTTAAQLDALFNEWVDKAARNGWLKPQGVMGLFPCWSEGEQVVVLDPDDASHEIARVVFNTVIGAGEDDLVSGAQFFTPRGEVPEPGVMGLQITTSGPQVDAFIEKMKAEGDSESALFLQGLSDRIAEDMAEHLNGLQRELLGIGPKAGLRWSPGYPGMSDIQMNRVIMETLHAGPAIGVVITPAGEFSPTGTTAAAVSFHPDARYS